MFPRIKAGLYLVKPERGVGMNKVESWQLQIKIEIKFLWNHNIKQIQKIIQFINFSYVFLRNIIVIISHIGHCAYFWFNGFKKSKYFTFRSLPLFKVPRILNLLLMYDTSYSMGK